MADLAAKTPNVLPKFSPYSFRDVSTLINYLFFVAVRLNCRRVLVAESPFGPGLSRFGCTWQTLCWKRMNNRSSELEIVKFGD